MMIYKLQITFGEGYIGNILTVTVYLQFRYTCLSPDKYIFGIIVMIISYPLQFIIHVIYVQLLIYLLLPSRDTPARTPGV